MNHHLLIPLATASAIVTIARPAMAASTGATLATLGYTGSILGFVGIGLMSLQYLLVKFNNELDPEEKIKNIATSKIFRAGMLLVSGAIAIKLVWILNELF